MRIRKLFVHVVNRPDEGWGWEMGKLVKRPTPASFPKTYETVEAAIHAARAAAGKACKASRRSRPLVQVIVHDGGHQAVDSAFTPESRKPRLTYSPAVA